MNFAKKGVFLRPTKYAKKGGCVHLARRRFALPRKSEVIYASYVGGLGRPENRMLGTPQKSDVSYASCVEDMM